MQGNIDVFNPYLGLTGPLGIFSLFVYAGNAQTKPIRNIKPKIGRNDPCGCKIGKQTGIKSKHCCHGS